MIRVLLLFLTMLFLYSCSDDDDKDKYISMSQENIVLGQKVFEKNCIVCHGYKGQGRVKDWKKPLENGKYPPPPLNGSAHTWHHPPKLLLRILNEGGAKLGGSMPGFRDKLTDTEKLAVIDYIYSLWPSDLKKRYDQQFN